MELALFKEALVQLGAVGLLIVILIIGIRWVAGLYLSAQKIQLEMFKEQIETQKEESKAYHTLGSETLTALRQILQSFEDFHEVMVVIKNNQESMMKVQAATEQVIEESLSKILESQKNVAGILRRLAHMDKGPQ